MFPIGNMDYLEKNDHRENKCALQSSRDFIVRVRQNLPTNLKRLKTSSFLNNQIEIFINYLSTGSQLSANTLHASCI